MTTTEPRTELDNKGPSKEKLKSIMEAASALTALGDEESENGSRPGSPTDSAPATEKEEPKPEEDGVDEADEIKRYLPEHKKPDAALTFPEKLMKLMKFAETQGDDFCVAWMEDGKSFIIRKPDEFTRNVVPKFFKATKFSSFTRKLYRWGFRQVNRGIGPDDPIIFGNEHFQKGQAELMANMRSVTAAATRKQEQQRSPMGYVGMKHPMDGMLDEGSHKRMMMDHIYQQKASMLQNPAFFGGMGPTGSLSLTNALRPNMAMPTGAMDMMGMRMGMGGAAPGMNFEMMMNGNHLNQFIPQQMQQNSVVQGSGGSNYPNQSSTAEIVNAAIAALRYAN